MNPINTRAAFRIMGMAGLLLGSILEPGPVKAASLPNFIFILVDDLGWTDLGCMGSAFYETPHIDRLAAQGMKFTQAYAACTVCSPTRAAILTGKYPARLHLTDWIAGHLRPKAKLQVPDWTMHLPLEEVTVAEALKPARYATISIGKWHLGGEQFWPTRQGFDQNIGGCDRGQPPSYFAPYHISTLREGPKGEYLTDRETDEAVRFLEAHRTGPFFLYLPHYAVHTPLQAKKDRIEKYRKKLEALPGSPQRNPVYAAMIESVDESVGRIQAKLEELNMADRTVVIFTSDNGGLTLGRPTPVTSNRPLRAGKGSSYEGGVRVPLIVKWPGVTHPGSLRDEPVMSIDFYPTLLDIAGLRGDPRHVPDGLSLVPLLKGEPGFKRDALYWHYPHYHPGGATPYGAIRDGDYRLVEFYEDGHVELYDLKNDLGEQHDLAASMPEKARALELKLDAWRRRVGAQMPLPNPNYEKAASNSR
jgi:arylsulfatase A